MTHKGNVAMKDQGDMRLTEIPNILHSQESFLEQQITSILY